MLQIFETISALEFLLASRVTVHMPVQPKTKMPHLSIDFDLLDVQAVGSLESIVRRVYNVSREVSFVDLPLPKPYHGVITSKHRVGNVIVRSGFVLRALETARISLAVVPYTIPQKPSVYTRVFQRLGFGER